MHAYLPSPSQGVWHLGPLPLRAYAFCIILGIIVAIWLGQRRWAARGGDPAFIADVAVWCVPFGIIGGRIYHVISSPDAYFGDGGDPWKAFAVWEGGLGIWGAVVLGGVGAWIACRRGGVPLPPLGDAIAPGIVLAQGIGRLGNWFNQELFGEPSTLPWALQIDVANRPSGFEQFATFHPAFLYELLWDVGVAVLVIWADRRFRLGHGRAFALYVAAYTAGRVWIEYLRIDPAEHVLGLRLNVWVSIVVFAGAVLYIAISAKVRPGREDPSELRGAGSDAALPGESGESVEGTTAEQPGAPTAAGRADVDRAEGL